MTDDDGDDAWQVLRGLSGWTRQKRLLASTCMYTAYGQAQLRFRKRFRGGLGLIAEANDDETSMPRPHQLQQWFHHAKPYCCLQRGFDAHIRRRMRLPSDIRKPEIQQLVLDALKNAPIDNINNENRFAKHGTHKASSHGNPPTASSTAADHVLGEFDLLHRLDLIECPVQLHYFELGTAAVSTCDR